MAFGIGIASAQQEPTSDIAQAANPFADVPANHWAYDAVRQLAADGYIQGYPDGQFKGQRPMTRYEMAVLTDRAVRSIEAKLAQLQQVQERDIAAIRRLIDAFRPELAALRQQVAALQAHQADQDKALTDLKRQADAATLRLNQMKIGGQFLFRSGTSSQNIQVFNPGPTTGSCAAASYCTAGSFSAGGAGGGNAASPGVFSHGINYTLARLVVSGQLDPRFSYGMRLKYQQNFANAAGTGASTLSTAYCTAVPNTGAAGTAAQNLPNCAFQNGQSKIPVFLDYAYAAYTSPGGIYGQIGRFSVGEGTWTTYPEQLVFGGQAITGAALGFLDPNNRVQGAFYYGLPNLNGAAIQAANAPTITTGSPCTHPVNGTGGGVVGLNWGPTAPTTITGVNPWCSGGTPFEIGAWGSYYFPSTGTGIGLVYDSYMGAPFTYWVPSAIGCSGVGGATVAVSASACVANGGAVGSAATRGNFFTVQGNNSYADIFVHQELGNRALPQFSLEGEVVRHLGSDPFVGGAWVGANAIQTAITYASKGNLYSPGHPLGCALISCPGTANSNVVQLAFSMWGLNSAGGFETGDFTGSTVLENMMNITNPGGMAFAYLTFQHWFSKNFRAGIVAIHGQLIPGVTLPVSSYSGTGAASANTCGGCFANNYTTNQLYLDSFLSF